MECSTESINNIVNIYMNTAKGYGKSIEEHNYEEANSSFEKNEEIFNRLVQMGNQGSRALYNLLHHKDLHIRISAAKHLLNTYTNEAITVLKDISVDSGFCGLRARIALEDFRINNTTVPKF